MMLLFFPLLHIFILIFQDGRTFLVGRTACYGASVRRWSSCHHAAPLLLPSPKERRSQIIVCRLNRWCDAGTRFGAALASGVIPWSRFSAVISDDLITSHQTCLKPKSFLTTLSCDVLHRGNSQWNLEKSRADGRDEILSISFRDRVYFFMLSIFTNENTSEIRYWRVTYNILSCLNETRVNPLVSPWLESLNFAVKRQKRSKLNNEFGYHWKGRVEIKHFWNEIRVTGMKKGGGRRLDWELQECTERTNVGEWGSKSKSVRLNLRIDNNRKRITVEMTCAYHSQITVFRSVFKQRTRYLAI